MGDRLFTDKLVFRWLEVLGVWSLDSATPVTSAYPAHASGAPWGNRGTGEQGQRRKVANLIRKSLRKDSVNDYSA